MTEGRIPSPDGRNEEEIEKQYFRYLQEEKLRHPEMLEELPEDYDYHPEFYSNPRQTS